MRRTLLLVAALAVVTVGCGGDHSADPDDSGAPDSSESTVAGPTTTAIPKPEVSLPSELPTELVVTELEAGEGHEAVAGDILLVQYVGVRSEDGQEFDSNYGADPIPVTLGAGGVIPGWEQGLIGAQQGDRLQLDIPADLAYGDQARGVIQAGDALSFVVDVVAVLPIFTPEDEPVTDVQPADNVSEIESTELVEGDGDELAAGKTAILHLVAYRADTGEKVTTTWGQQPLTFVNSEQSEVFPGLLEAVSGMKVGGRRQAQVPYTMVFNGEGSESIGFPPEVDIVFVLDLVGQF